MKVLLVAINAKYIHSSLSIRDLKTYCDKLCIVDIRDYTVNEELQNIIADIYYAQPDIVGFSCYIWNIEGILKIAGVLKKILPNLIIIFGGPEVSFNSQEYIDKYKFIDTIICGEGEATLKEFLEAFIKNDSIVNIPGLSFRKAGKTYINPFRTSQPALDCIPFAYTKEDLKTLENKLIYYESSRGCTFGCTYCLSGAGKHVRYLSPERVEHDIKLFIDSGIKQVKFVDRTFNLNKKHALYVWNSILTHFKPDINFHFEIAADLLDKEILDFLATIPKGLFQFEVGVQSTNENTLSIINRKSDIAKIKENVTKLIEKNNIHIHLDLIAGLPLETLKIFSESFNEVYTLQPHQLQLGFLKILPGTKINGDVAKFGIVSATFPPYEVIQTSTLTFAELLTLKEIEKVVENFYNSSLFIYIFKYIFSRWDKGAFNFYKEFADFILSKNTKETSIISRAKNLYDFISNCWPEDNEIQKQIIILDLLGNQKTFSLPEWLDFNREYVKHYTSEKLKNKEFISSYLPYDQGTNLRTLIKNILILPLDLKVMKVITNSEKDGIALFDYTKSDRLTGRACVKLLVS